MANNKAEIELVLKTKGAIQEAQEASKDIQKALSYDVEGSGNEYLKNQQAILRDNLAEAKLLKQTFDATGKVISEKLSKGLRPEGLTEYQDKLKAVSDLVDAIDSKEQELAENRKQQSVVRDNLPSLRGKIGSAASRGGDVESARAAYDAEKAKLAELQAQEKALITEQNELNNSFDAEYSKIKYIVDKMQVVSTVISENKAGVDGMVNTWDALHPKVEEVEKSQEQITQSASEATQQTRSEAEAMQDAANAAENLASAKAKAEDAGKTAPKTRSNVSGWTADDATENLTKTKSAAKDATVTIEDLKEKLAEALNFDRANAGIGDYVDHLAQLKKLDTTIQKAGAAKTLGEQYQELRKDIVWTKLDIKECDKEFTQAYKAMQSGAEGTASSTKKAGDSVSKLGGSIKNGLSSVLPAVRVIEGGIKNAFSAIVSVVKGASSAIKSALKLAINALKSFKSSVLSVVKNIKATFSNLVRTIHNVRNHFNGMAHDSRGNFKHMITNITKYVLGFRSLFFLVRRLRKYIGEGIQNMAKFNGGNNDVNRNISKLLQSLTFLKNAWATAFDPILTFVTPWLTGLIDKLAEVGNAFSRFLGNLLGVGDVFQAKKGPAQNYAKSLDSAGSSAGKAAKKQKKLNDRIAEFDDLILLGRDKDPNNGAGTGGGGGAGNNKDQDPNKMFNIKAIADNLKKAFKEMWAVADFSAWGEKIGQAIIKGLNNIKWNEIQTTLYKIGRSIATFLDGVFADPNIWSSIGNTLAQGVNSLLQLVFGFLENDETSWGKGLAKIIISFFNNVDWDTIKKNIELLGKKLVDNINAFFAELKTGDIESKISGLTESITKFIVNLITGINWKDVIDAFSRFGSAVISGIQQGLSESDSSLGTLIGEFLSKLQEGISNKDASTISAAVLDLIISAVSKIDLSGVMPKLLALGSSLLGGIQQGLATSESPVLQAFSNLIGQIKTFLETGDISSLVSGFTSLVIKMLENIKWDQILPAIGKVIDQLLSGLASSLSKSDNSTLNSLGALITGIKDALNTLWPVIQQVISTVNPIIQAILPVLQAILPPLASLISQLVTTVMPLLQPILNAITPILTQIVTAILPVFSAILTSLQPVIDAFITKILPMLTSVISSFMPVLQSVADILVAILGNSDGVSTSVMDIVATVLPAFIGLMKPLNEILAVVLDLVKDLLGPIIALIGPLLQVLGECLKPLFSVFDDLGGLLSEIMVPLLKLISSVIKVIVVPALQLLVTIVQAIVQVFMAWKNTVADVVTAVKSGIKNLWDSAKPVFNSILGGVETVVNGIVNGINKAIKALNAAQFTVPDWIPLIGGKKFNLNLREVSTVKLPRLAQGAVIPPNREFMAMLGDQSHGTNIEAPLDTIKQAVAEVMANNGSAEMIQLLQELITVVEHKNLVIGDKEIGRANARYNKQQSIVRGTSF